VRYRLTTAPGVQVTAREVVAWYDAQGASSGTTASFLADLDATFRLLKTAPLACRVDDRFGLRRAHLHRFPYNVWFDVDGRTTTVLALTHDRLSGASVAERLRAD